MGEMLTMISFPSSYSAAVALVLPAAFTLRELREALRDAGLARTGKGRFDGWKLRLK